MTNTPMQDERPSRTASKVAMNILTLGAVPELARDLPPGSADVTARLLMASGAASETSIRLARSPRMVHLHRAFDWMMPGQFESFADRKAFCERQTRAAIAAGATQVLVLGAGYDTMGWRLAPEFPSVNFFEIDHPATARLKARGIEALGPRPNLHLVAEDLGERRLADVSRDNEYWNDRASTVIIAEGLLQYLTPEAVLDLFRQCGEICGEGRMAFTSIPAGEDGRPEIGRWTGLVMWLLKAGGEPWLWSVRPEEIDEYLRNTGWSIAREPGEEPRMHGVELYFVAVKARSDQ